MCASPLSEISLQSAYRHPRSSSTKLSHHDLLLLKLTYGLVFRVGFISPFPCHANQTSGFICVPPSPITTHLSWNKVTMIYFCKIDLWSGFSCWARISASMHAIPASPQTTAGVAGVGGGGGGVIPPSQVQSKTLGYHDLRLGNLTRG